MKNIKRVFIMSLLCFFLCSSVIYAIKVDVTTYEAQYIPFYKGTASECTLFGASMVTHMSVGTTTSSSKYNVVTIREYMYDEGWTANMGTDEATCESGYSVGVIVRKRKSLKGYYFHIGKCYANFYSGQLYDTYYYTAIQE